MEQAALAIFDVSAGRSGRFETWTLSAPAGGLAATFVPRAGMIGCSLRHAGEELLHRGGGLERYVAEGATFGIPLLYRWGLQARRSSCSETSTGSRSTGS